MSVSSLGSTPEVEDINPVMKNSFLSYFIWFLIGCLAHFGIQLFIISTKHFTVVLEIMEDNSGAFQANMVALEIFSFFIGFILSYILYPLNLVCLEVSIFFSLVSFVFLSLLIVVHKTVAFYGYILTVILTCACFGIMEMIGITAANDPGLPGEPTDRIIAFLVGHPFGFLVVLVVTLLVELGSFGKLIETSASLAALYSLLGILGVIIFGLPFIFYTISYLYYAGRRSYARVTGNIKYSLIYFYESWRILRYCLQYIMILIIVQSAEAFLNSGSVLFLCNPYPQFESINCSLGVLILYAVFDFFGRAFSSGVRKMAEFTKERHKKLYEISREQGVNEYKELMVIGNGNDNNNKDNKNGTEVSNSSKEDESTEVEKVEDGKEGKNDKDEIHGSSGNKDNKTQEDIINTFVSGTGTTDGISGDSTRISSNINTNRTTDIRKTNHTTYIPKDNGNTNNSNGRDIDSNNNNTNNNINTNIDDSKGKKPCEGGKDTLINIDYVNTQQYKTNKRILNYKQLLIVSWLMLSFRYFTGFCVFFQRHFYENYALNTIVNLQGIIITMMVNSAIRGFVLTYVYSNIFETSVLNYLNDVRVSIHPVDGEPNYCVHARYDATVISSLVVSAVAVIDVVVFIFWSYLGYKYNRILYEAELIRDSLDTWPTDHLKNNFYKLLWWFKNVGLLIWKDIRHPFDLF